MISYPTCQFARLPLPPQCTLQKAPQLYMGTGDLNTSAPAYASA